MPEAEDPLARLSKLDDQLADRIKARKEARRAAAASTGASSEAEPIDPISPEPVMVAATTAPDTLPPPDVTRRVSPPDLGPRRPERDPALAPRFASIQSLLHRVSLTLRGSRDFNQIAALLHDCDDQISKLLADSVDGSGDERVCKELRVEYDRLFSEPEAARAAAAGGPPGLVRPELGRVPNDHALEEARLRYVKAQKHLHDVSGVGGALKGFISGTSRDKVAKELEQAKAEYQKLRAEYVDASAQKYLEEQNRLLDARFANYSQETGLGKKLYNGYKKLGQINLLEVGARIVGNKEYKAQGRLAKMVNLRTGISLGLLATGVGFGATSAVGISAVLLRRGLSGVGTGVGSYDLLNFARGGSYRGGLEKNINEINSTTGPDKATVEANLAELESRALLDGRSIESLRNDELYKKLLAERDKYLAESIAGQSAQLLSTLSSGTETLLDIRLRKEKNWRFGMAVLSTTLAGIVGTGGVSKMLGGKWVWEGHNIPNPIRPGVHPTGLDTHQGATFAPVDTGHGSGATLVDTGPVEHGVKLAHGATMDVQGNEVIIHAGKHGIEGAMIALQDKNPEAYARMIAKLHEQFPNFKGNDGGLIDQYIRDLGTKNDFSVGGAHNDVNWISKMALKINADGSLEISEKPEFLSETSNPFTHHEEVANLNVKTGLPSELQHMEPLEASMHGAPHADFLNTHSTHHATSHYFDQQHSAVDTDSASDTGTSPTQRLEWWKGQTGARDPVHVSELLKHPGWGVDKTVKYVLDNNAGQYKEFVINRLGLTKESYFKALNKMTTGQFFEKLVNSDEFAERYSKLAGLMKEGGLNDTKAPMKKVLVILAERFQRGN